MSQGKKPQGQVEDLYEGIVLTPAGDRPLGSRPPRVQASRKLLRMVEEAQEECSTTEEWADWVANFAENFAGYGARPVMFMDTDSGNGPLCSVCAQPWGWCGHHLMTATPVGPEPEEGDQ